MANSLNTTGLTLGTRVISDTIPSQYIRYEATAYTLEGNIGEIVAACPNKESLIEPATFSSPSGTWAAFFCNTYGWYSSYPTVGYDGQVGTDFKIKQYYSGNTGSGYSPSRIGGGGIFIRVS